MRLCGLHVGGNPPARLSHHITTSHATHKQKTFSIQNTSFLDIAVKTTLVLGPLWYNNHFCGGLNSKTLPYSLDLFVEKNRLNAN